MNFLSILSVFSCWSCCTDIYKNIISDDNSNETNNEMLNININKNNISNQQNSNKIKKTININETTKTYKCHTTNNKNMTNKCDKKCFNCNKYILEKQLLQCIYCEIVFHRKCSKIIRLNNNLCPKCESNGIIIKIIEY